jgi:hypothetical protein
MSSDEEQRFRQREAAPGVTKWSREEDSMECVHRDFDRRNLRSAVELILASPDAEEIVEELKRRLAQRGRTSV